MNSVKYLIKYERFNMEPGTTCWELITKSFDTRQERSKFIFRIMPNVLVKRIWTLEEYL